jgi:uncharacterized protein (UPF0332 family)
LKPRDLIATARSLLEAGKSCHTEGAAEAALRRAVSSCYYALFHALARQCADLLIGRIEDREQRREIWRHVYRALNHGDAKEKCMREEIKEFGENVLDFADAFVDLQIKRHSADYDPDPELSDDPPIRFTEETVANVIKLSEVAIDSLEAAPEEDRRAFCAFILLKSRNEDGDLERLKQARKRRSK